MSAHPQTRTTAADRIASTLRELSRPGPDADGMELTLASVAMGLEGSLAGELTAKQETGELDEFVLALTRFLAMHRSDNADALIVVEMPRGAMQRHDVPAATGLHRLNEAIAASEHAGVPW